MLLSGKPHTPDVVPMVSHLPLWNSMAMFVVQPGRSFHSVQVRGMSQGVSCYVDGYGAFAPFFGVAVQGWGLYCVASRFAVEKAQHSTAPGTLCTSPGPLYCIVPAGKYFCGM